LLVNPAAGLERCQVLSGEVIVLVVLAIGVHDFVDLVKVEKWDHGVAVVLGMVVGIPQECPNKDIRSDASRILQAVRSLRDFACKKCLIRHV